MNADMIIGQAMQNYIMKDLSFKVLDECWSTCYDQQVTANELAKGELEKAKLKKMSKCQHRCINRHFEVMKMMTEAREQREREMAMGLNPGALAPGTAP